MRVVYRPDHPMANENGMVPVDLAGPRNENKPTLGVISDTMDALKHPGTGQIIDSKARFREHTRASGCVEVGTEPMRPGPRYDVPMSDVVSDVKRSLAELRSR